jgi:serine-type D-Ala-D-Ala endopeptidase (penicillin-binding protein 7)
MVGLGGGGGARSLKSARIAKSGKSAKVAKVGRYAKQGRAAKGQKIYVKNRHGRRVLIVRAPPPPPKPTMGQLAGLHNLQDPLELKSSVALVVDQQTNEVLVSKNADAILPIASITKLMTAIIVLDGPQDLNELVDITDAEVDTEKGTRSRLTIGTQLSRKELLHLALMSSENRAAHALGRSYPGGVQQFVALMNAKARSLGMRDTIYADPTGLSNLNRSSAQDLAKLVQVAYKYPVIRHYSTDQGMEVANSTGRQLRFNNTNRLVLNPEWNIGLQKTGFISEAGQCLVMQAQVQGRNVIMVFLDSVGKLSRIGDASRVRTWLESAAVLSTPLQPIRVQRST